MKNFYLFLGLFAFSFASHAQFPAPYCGVTFTNGVEPITLVNFAGINNTSPAAIGGLPLEDFTAMMGNVSGGVSYPISLNGNTDGAFTNYFVVYIDWNRNNDFTDPGEAYPIGTIIGNNGSGPALTGNISVPLTATAGVTRMRVTKRFSVAALPCQTGPGFGQAEDYSLTVTAGASCAGTPTIGPATSSAASACVGVAFTLNATNTPAAGLSFQWQSSTDAGVTWTNLGASQASSSYTVTSQSVATSYRVIITCAASTLTATSTPVVVAQNLPANCYCTNAINFNCTDGDLITNVTFGTINNETLCGNATTGYTSYVGTVLSPAFPAGSTQPISVTVGGGFASESVGVWIDYNKNGAFEASEYTYVGTGSATTLTSNIAIPASALTGPTRMRVVVAAAVAASFTTAFSCGPLTADNPFGEMEDYTVIIDAPLSTPGFNANSFSMYPNPTTGLVNIQFANQILVKSINVYSVSGQLVLSQEFNANSDTYTIDVQRAATGVYIVKMETENGTQIRRLIKN